MIIKKNFSDYVVVEDDLLSRALEKISVNKSGIVFVVSNDGKISGALTDGDLRRWLLQNPSPNINASTSRAASNEKFVAVKYGSPAEEIRNLLNSRVKCLPLIDHQGRLVAVALNSDNSIQIGDSRIDQNSPAYIIAEIGNNHNGSLELAKQLVDEAVKAGADAVKFQMRDMECVYGDSYKISDAGDLGVEYTLDLLDRFQLSVDQMFEVFDYSKSLGVTPLCTPWDSNSLRNLESYGMEAYKLASADLTNEDLLLEMCKTHKPLICSTGMSNELEIIEAINLIRSQGSQFVMLHCNSTYPAPFKDVNLKYLAHLKELCLDSQVGYSGHERGYAVPIAAVAMGAKVIEKHFTLDKGMEGNDHKVSLLPAEFKSMVDAIRQVEESLGVATTRIVTQGEMMNREVLGKSLVSTKDLKVGEIILNEYLGVRSPGKGLPPSKRKNLVGKILKRDVRAGDYFYPSDLLERDVSARAYSFSRPFGVPVRYHDMTSMIPHTNLDLVEFHFSYRDLDLSPDLYLDESGYDLDLVVHSPELFYGDHLMDLCSEDAIHRERSIKELQKVIDVTRDLKKYFKKSSSPLIIINAGGFTLNGFMDPSDRAKKYELIAESLSRLDDKGVEIIPQTMPPFPWHFGGQRFHNLFLTAEDIVGFCERYQKRVCLDVSHSKLACNFSHASFSDFLDLVCPVTAHIHIVDALGVDGEGLQIGEGDIDFSLLGKKINESCPRASFIPEIWQGHKNNGEGFWIALDLLEKFLRDHYRA